jgi:hypothetical protein
MNATRGADKSLAQPRTELMSLERGVISCVEL